MPNSRLLPRRGTCVRTPHTARTCEPDHGALGFELRSDETFADGKMRWIEVAPAGGSTAIVDRATVGRRPDIRRHRIVISTSDIEADHTALKAAGVDVDAEIAHRATQCSGRGPPRSPLRAMRRRPEVHADLSGHHPATVFFR